MTPEAEGLLKKGLRLDTGVAKSRSIVDSARGPRENTNTKNTARDFLSVSFFLFVFIIFFTTIDAFC